MFAARSVRLQPPTRPSASREEPVNSDISRSLAIRNFGGTRLAKKGDTIEIRAATSEHPVGRAGRGNKGERP